MDSSLNISSLLTSLQPSSFSPASTSTSAFKSESDYNCDYLSIDDILSSNQRVSCKFEVNISKLGFIDTSSDCDDIQEGTKLELPFWLAKDFYSQGLVTIETPKGYNQVYREILEADSNIVNLHKLCPNYYKFGTHLAKSKLPDSQAIAKSLLDTFYQRLRRIMDNSSNSAAVQHSGTIISFVIHQWQLSNT